VTCRLLYFLLLIPWLLLAQDADPSLAVKDALTKWMETQRIISQEQANAKSSKLALQGRIALIQGELDEFSGKVAKSSEDISKEETRKSNLQKDLESAKLAPKILQDAISTLETEIMKLKQTLPGPVLEKTKALYDRVPTDPKNTKVSLAERYQNILGILNEADKANNELMLVSEVRQLPDTKPTEVETLYVGLAQAYFVNAERTLAGSGRPVNGSWVWTRDDRLSSEVAAILAVMAAKGKPKFVQLPAQLD
jgi:hypothetical protein